VTDLGEILRTLSAQTGRPQKSLTVMARQHDPFRLDTPAGHEKGQWFRDALEQVGLGAGVWQAHLRGIHYRFVAHAAIMKLDGSTYQNTEDDWLYLQSEASKAARWLGYVPFESIVDERNEEPEIRETPPQAGPDGGASVYAGYVQTDDLPSPEAIGFDVAMSFPQERQPYRLVIYGEKSSLAPVLKPVAEDYTADLYLPSGGISDSHLALMARTGAADGRPMIVFCFTDCDPSGYQMAVSIAHKLRALKTRFYPDLRFEVHAPALTVEQVQRLALPSTPLKETEKRADGWRARYGVQQTEIDALASLQPQVLREIVEQAIWPFYDHTLLGREQAAQAAWHREASRLLADTADDSVLDGIRADVAHHVAGLAGINDRLWEAEAEVQVQFPDYTPPEVEIDEGKQPEPLVHSDMPLDRAIDILKARKDYSGTQS
jgi:hypothetical protein